jgi:hypothetical protein
MANHYTQFSESLAIKSPAEEQWLREQLASVFLTESKQLFTAETQQLKESGETYEELPRFQAEALQRGVTDCSLDFVGFCWDIQKDDGGTSLWIYAEESGDVEQVAYFVQLFLKRFAPDGWWTLTWANTCSRMLVGQFSGGAVLVTPGESFFECSTRWLEARQLKRSLSASQRR